jgi:hypothetical protein
MIEAAIYSTANFFKLFKIGPLQSVQKLIYLIRPNFPLYTE